MLDILSLFSWRAVNSKLKQVVVAVNMDIELASHTDRNTSLINSEFKKLEVGDETTNEFEKAITNNGCFTEANIEMIVVNNGELRMFVMVNHKGATVMINVVVLVCNSPDRNRGAKNEMKGGLSSEKSTRRSSSDPLDFRVTSLQVGKKSVLSQKETETLERISIEVVVDSSDI